MKKLIAGLLGIVLSVMCVIPARAQNFPNTVIAMAIGAPGVILNSASSTNWGEVFNSKCSTRTRRPGTSATARSPAR